MPTFQVEMLWDCSKCGAAVRGRHKSCTECGKAKEGEPFYDDPSHGEVGVEDAVTDPEFVRQAEAGADWQCKYCGSHSRRDSGECGECGSLQGNSRETETRWDDGTVGTPGEGMNDLEEAKFVVDRGIDEDLRAWSEPLNDGTRPATRLEIPPPPLPGRGRRAVTALAVAAVLGLACLMFFFLFRTREVEAEVVSTQWSRTVKVDRYQVVTEEGWDPPGDAISTDDLGRRVHHYDKVLTGYKSVNRQEKYPCGEDCRTTPRECRTTPVRCRKNDNGFKTCSGGDRVCSGGDKICSTKYCSRTVTDRVARYDDVPAHRTWYRWAAWRWRPNRTVSESGESDPRWPDAERIGLCGACGPGEQERESGRAESYSVRFMDEDGDPFSMEPGSEAEFLSLPKGARRTLLKSHVSTSVKP